MCCADMRWTCRPPQARLSSIRTSESAGRRAISSWRRDRIPSFANTWRRCHSTVRRLRKSRAPMSGFERPSLASSAICRSCGVRSSRVSTVRFRTVSPVACSSRRGRSANASFRRPLGRQQPHRGRHRGGWRQTARGRPPGHFQRRRAGAAHRRQLPAAEHADVVLPPTAREARRNPLSRVLPRRRRVNGSCRARGISPSTPLESLVDAW